MMKVLFFWGGPGNMDRQFGNPYARLLATALEQHGVTLEVAKSLNLWHHVFRSDIQAMHFNWIAPHYAAERLPRGAIEIRQLLCCADRRVSAGLSDCVDDAQPVSP